MRERKRAVRLVIEDVTIHKTDQIVAHIRFKDGATQTITVPLPPPFAQSRFESAAYCRSRPGLLLQYAALSRTLHDLFVRRLATMFLSMMVFSQNRMDGCFCISHIAHVFGAKKHPMSTPDHFLSLGQKLS